MEGLAFFASAAASTATVSPLEVSSLHTSIYIACTQCKHRRCRRRRDRKQPQYSDSQCHEQLAGSGRQSENRVTLDSLRYHRHRSASYPYLPRPARQLAVAALVEREVPDEPGEGESVARGDPDDHAPTPKAGTGAPEKGDSCGESQHAEPVLPGLYVLTEIKLHVSSGLWVKVIGRVKTTTVGCQMFAIAGITLTTAPST